MCGHSHSELTPLSLACEAAQRSASRSADDQVRATGLTACSRSILVQTTRHRHAADASTDALSTGDLTGGSSSSECGTIDILNRSIDVGC
jgi:hypothetical protein